MREIFQCIFCASIGFITASLLAAGKYNSSETDTDDSTQNDIITEIPTATGLTEIPKGT